MADLANHYMYGRGVPRDFAKALRWLQPALEHEDRYAQSHLGMKMAWALPERRPCVQMVSQVGRTRVSRWPIQSSDDVSGRARRSI